MRQRTVPAERSALRLAVTPLTRVAVRDASGTGDGSWTMEGYATVFEQETVLYDGRWVRIREEIARDALDDVVARVDAGDELVHLNFGHDMNTAIAATDAPEAIGRLELDADFHGLRYFARVDQEDPDAIRLAVKMRRGVVRQASFAFTIADEELVESTQNDDGVWDDKWRILKVGHLYDVCACAQGAYPQTESHVRDWFAASVGRAGFDPAGLERRAREERAGAGRAVADTEPPGAERSGGTASHEQAARLRLARARAHAGHLAHNLNLKETPR